MRRVGTRVCWFSPPAVVVGRVWLTVCLAWLAGCAKGPDTVSSPKGPSITDQTVAQHNQGVAFMGQFEYAKAVDVFAQLVQEHPQWTEAKVDLAIATLNRQQPEDAQKAAALLDEVLQNEPDNVRGLYCRGILDRQAGNPSDALARFRQVCQADPNDAYAVYYAGQCLLDMTRVDEALAEFRRAQQIDPYLRSAYYGAFQAAQRLRDMPQARQYLEQFEKYKDNPQARLAEIKYTRMGPKAEVHAAVADTPPTPAHPPKGPAFASAAPLKIRGGDQLRWATASPGTPAPSLTACDIDGDGRLDLFVAAALDGDQGVHNAVLWGRDDGFELAADHALARVSQVNAALWGDYDNDGLTDVYLCRQGPNQLWRHTGPGQWQDVTPSTKTDGGSHDTVDGAFFDADHDGDLDLMLINSDGPNELLNNNLDGTFRPLAQQYGLTGGRSASCGIVVADLDSDRDVDIVVVNNPGPHEVYLNDRLWSYHPADGFDEFRNAPIVAALAADTDANGQNELITVSPKHVYRWTPDEAGTWTAHPLARASDLDAPRFAGPLAICDVDGNGVLDLLVSSGDQWSAATLAPDGTALFRSQTEGLSRWTVVALDDQTGPSVVGLRSGQPPMMWRPGPGRYPFTLLSFTGKEDKAEQMRSNASGIGVRAAVRLGGRFTSIHTYRNQSGPGQSLQPIAAGLGPAKQIDFVSIDWPDGLFQTEIDLTAGKVHRIEETQRQVSSCPVVFAWNGRKFEFVTDVLGVGGIGFHLGDGQYASSRPWENLLLPRGALEPKDDCYQINIGEPMEEACYLDSVRLAAYDLPPGWQMTIDERFAEDGPEPSGAPVFYQRRLLPKHAANDRGQDVTQRIVEADGKAAPPAPRDRRFIGRTQQHTITLVFDEPIDVLPGQPILVFDGWVEYPYSQTRFAAWQAGADYRAPTVEARGTDGRWRVILQQFGYMAGMPRQASVPLPKDQLPPGTSELRITTNLEIYWDRLFVVGAVDCPEALRRELPLRHSEAREVGFARRSTLAQRRPYYDYEDRRPLWDTRHQTGYYTRLGPIRPLLAQTDDAVAIIGPGEEIHLQFGPALPPVPPGYDRRFVLESSGWCKDMDLYTKGGDRLEPLPRRQTTGDQRSARSASLHRQFNTRYRSGS